MGLSTVADTGYALWKTLEISVPTVVDALAGRLTVERSDARLRSWSQALLDRAEVELSVSGLDRVPLDRAYVLMSNHQSHFDVPILYRAWPGTLRMVAKAELFRVPVWGRAMRAAGFVAVDRSGNRAKAEAAMRAAGEAIRAGVSIWIAPEGTRSEDGQLGKFKKGGFLLALETRTPIVPIAISGSRDILPKHTRAIVRGARVQVTFGAPIDPSRPSEIDPRRGSAKVAALSTEVRDFISAHLVK
ncbi:MAG TPA: lysophospholipid acyltransferase family protein [Polyangia bacterium]